MVPKNQVNRATRSGAMAIFQFSSLNLFQKFPETIKTLKEWFLSKKGPKEGERVARGHFHERVGESPVHWLPPGVGFTQNTTSTGGGFSSTCYHWFSPEGLLVLGHIVCLPWCHNAGPDCSRRNHWLMRVALASRRCFVGKICWTRPVWKLSFSEIKTKFHQVRKY